MKELFKKIKYQFYKLDWWMFYHSPIYFNFQIFTILSEWFAARKYYKFPHVVFNHGEIWRYHTNTKYALFRIDINKLGWKWKWDYLSFESNPQICISILNKWFFNITFKAPIVDKKGYAEDHLYWESMLEYLYLYKKDIIKTYNNWGWIGFEDIYDEDKRYEIRYSTWNWNMLKQDKILDLMKNVDLKKIKLRVL